MSYWQWEALKMVGYIAFPVTAFHWFNQPDTFTEYVQNVREEFLGPEPVEELKQFNAVKDNYNKDKDLQALREMEERLLNKK